jgi:Zn-dependent protease with chaperone function
MSVISPAVESTLQNPIVSTEDLLAGLQGEIKPVRKPFLYQAGLFLVALAMVALPAIYVGLTAAAAYGVYYYAIHGTVILQGSGSRFRLLAYVTPLAIGSAIVVFMIKPLFAPRVQSRSPQALDPQREARLFAYVARLCRIVRTSPPKEICIDLDVNASASFRKGFLSFLGNDLRLTIGLPLVAGLDLRQLTGVLAHEFGHFAQGGAMRLTYVIRSVNLWFARVVYQRDELDVWIEETSENNTSGYVVTILGLCRGAVWMSRRVLWLLMIAGNAISSFQLRQMEFDADRHEARVAGSRAFEATARRLPLLGAATQSAYSELGRFWQERRLADDFPALILSHSRRFPAEVKDRIEASMLSRKTGIWDTHPSDADRIASASREAADGLVNLDLPASVLFADFEATSRSASLEHYRDSLGQDVTPSNLVRTEDLIVERTEIGDAHGVLARYFDPDILMIRPLRLSRADLDTDRSDLEPGVTADELARLRQSYDATGKKLKELQDRRFKLLAGRMLQAARVAIPPEMEGSQEEVDAAIAQVGRELEPMEAALRGKLVANLKRSAAEEVAESAAGRQEIDLLVTTLEGLEKAHPTLIRLWEEVNNLATLLPLVKPKEENAALVEVIISRSRQAREHLVSLQKQLETVGYPFRHARGQVSCAIYLCERVPENNEVGRLFELSKLTVQNFVTLYLRIAARLGARAESAGVKGAPTALAAS